MEFVRGKAFRLKEDVTPMGGEPAYAVRDGIIPKGTILRFLGMSESVDPVFHYNKEDGDTTHNTIIIPKQHLERFLEEVK